MKYMYIRWINREKSVRFVVVYSNVVFNNDYAFLDLNGFTRA